MPTYVKKNDLAYIIAPACQGARNHFVEVLRRATGDQDLDGVAFDREGGNPHTVVWVVRGHQIPWGDAFVNVFAIEDACLRFIRDRVDNARSEVLQANNTLEQGIA